MTKTFKLDFGTLKIIHKNILMSELNEGILLDVESNRKILQIGLEEFQGQPYGYISNRIFSYAVDPMVYKESADYPALKAIAVVTEREIGRKSAQVERSFYNDKNSFEIFGSLNEAIAWVSESLEQVKMASSQNSHQR